MSDQETHTGEKEGRRGREGGSEGQTVVGVVLNWLLMVLLW